MRFIVGERQTGKTRALVARALEADGFVVVASAERRESLLREYRDLKPRRVLTARSTRHGGLRGATGPVFIDGLEAILEACGLLPHFVDSITVNAEGLEPGTLVGFHPDD